MINIDPKLMKILKSSEKNKKIKAVILLEERFTNTNRGRKLIQEVNKLTNRKPIKIRVLPRLATIIIEADAEYIMKIISKSEVDSATLSD